MARIDIRYGHGTTRDEAVDSTREMLDRFAERRPDMVRSVQWSSDGSSAEVEGPMFKGQFKVTDSEVVVDLKLALLARPFKSQVREILEKKLVKAFGD